MMDFMFYLFAVISRRVLNIERASHFFNHAYLSRSKRLRVLRKACPGIDRKAAIGAPFHIEVGDNFKLGKGSFINSGCIVLNAATVSIGEGTLIGPGVIICTTFHHSDPLERAKDRTALSRQIYIGNNVWIGASATICPGVAIGDNSIIGAGSVVTRDIRAGVTAVGIPCAERKSWR